MYILLLYDCVSYFFNIFDDGIHEMSDIVKRKIVWKFQKCDPPYDFSDKGDNTLTTRFHLKTKEIDFNTLTKHARAHFNELVLLSHMTH